MLVTIGAATGRRDLIEIGLVSGTDGSPAKEAGPVRFLVHLDPPHRPDLIERYSYGCNGPIGDAQVFRFIAEVADHPAWTALAERCWHTVTRSGLPQRIRPGLCRAGV